MIRFEQVSKQFPNGTFAFPNPEAASIAVWTVNEWLNTHSNHFEKIIFNVFSEADYKDYIHIFETGK